MSPPRPRGAAGAADDEPPRDYALPALEIVAFDFPLNRFDNAYFGCCD